MAQYEPKDFSHVLGTPGFGDDLLIRHFDVYASHLVNLNALSDELAARPMNGAPSPDWCELKRRFGWEWNGGRLHELYFENLTRSPDSLEKSSDLAKALAAAFGSVSSWTRDFRATGCIRGVGWAALVRDTAADLLRNVWISEHDAGHLVGCPVILLMDVFEHAYAGNDGSKRTEYIDAFLAAIDWNVAEKRFAAATASVPGTARSSRRAEARRPLFPLFPQREGVGGVRRGTRVSGFGVGDGVAVGVGVGSSA